MSAGEQAHGVSLRDLNTHEADERRARHADIRDVRGEMKELAIRVDRIESIIDQMKGVRALMVTVFGTSVVTALISVITLVALVNGPR